MVCGLGFWEWGRLTREGTEDELQKDRVIMLPGMYDTRFCCIPCSSPFGISMIEEMCTRVAW